MSPVAIIVEIGRGPRECLICWYPGAIPIKRYSPTDIGNAIEETRLFSTVLSGQQHFIYW